ncbi:unnamed protein product, partial [Amoebophrya sp. A25]|eukprot:GSA25T00004500001.1
MVVTRTSSKDSNDRKKSPRNMLAEGASEETPGDGQGLEKKKGGARTKSANSTPKSATSASSKAGSQNSSKSKGNTTASGRAGKSTLWSFNGEQNDELNYLFDFMQLLKHPIVLIALVILVVIY